jgi:hypothetical protein
MAFHSILLVSMEFGAFAFGQTGFGFGDSDLGIEKSNINSPLDLLSTYLAAKLFLHTPSQNT